MNEIKIIFLIIILSLLMLFFGYELYKMKVKHDKNNEHGKIPKPQIKPIPAKKAYCDDIPVLKGYDFPETCVSDPLIPCSPTCSSGYIGKAEGNAVCQNDEWVIGSISGCHSPKSCKEKPIVSGFEFPESCENTESGQTCEPTGCAAGYLGSNIGYPATCNDGAWEDSNIYGCYPSKGDLKGVLMDTLPYPKNAPPQIKGWLWIKGDDGKTYNLLSVGDCGAPGKCVIFSPKPNGDANIVRCIPC